MRVKRPALRVAVAFGLGMFFSSLTFGLQVVGRWPYGACEAAAVDGDRWLAFIGNGSVLQTLDIRDSAVPELVGELPLDGPILDMSLSGSVLVIASGAAGLRLVDVADPRSPHLLAAMSLSTKAFSIALTGRYAVVGGTSDDDDGFQVIDISDPSHPFRAASLRMQAPQLSLSGTIAIAANGCPGYSIVDLSSPTQPQIVYQSGVFGEIDRVNLAGTLAVLGAVNGQRGLRLLDLSNPRAPKELSTLPTVTVLDYPLHFDMWDAFLAGERLYFAAGSYLVAADVSNPASPRQLGIVGSITDGAIPRVAAVVGDLVFSAHCYVGFRIFDFASPMQPMEVGSFHTAGAPSAIALGPGFAALVGSRRTSVNVLDVHEPAAPRFLFAFENNRWFDSENGQDVFSLAAAPGRVFLSAWYLASADISSPPEIRFTASLPTLSYILGRWRGWLFLNRGAENAEDSALCEAQCLQLVDSSDPSKLVAQPRVSGIAKPQAVAIGKGQIFVVDGHHAVHAFDASDAPRLRPLWVLPGAYDSVAILSNSLVAANSTGLHVFDVSGAGPVLLADVALTLSIPRLVSSGNMLFVTSWGCTTTLRGYDLTDPRAPQLMGTRSWTSSWSLMSDMERWTVADSNRVYVATREGMFVLEAETFPDVRVVSPPPGATIGGEVDLTFTATPSQSRIDFSCDGIPVGTQQNGGTLHLDTTRLTNGSHEIGALAVDSSGRASETHVEYNVLNASVSVRISADPGGTTDPKPGEYSLPKGSKLHLAAVADRRFSFSGWTGDVPQVDQAKAVLDVEVARELVIQAHFVEIRKVRRHLQHGK